MTNKEFFLLTLPDEGYYCAFVVTEKTKYQKFFDNRIELYDFLIFKDSQNDTVYYAQASFETPKSRLQDNVKELNCFWFDIDCGPGKPFDTQREGLIELDKFIIDTHLPTPFVVSSGNGLYAYWLLDDSVTREHWQPVADTIKKLAAQYHFKIDAGPTADCARVLRPCGSYNRKHGEKPVILVREAEIISIDDFGFEFEPEVELPELPANEFEVRTPNYPTITSDEVAQNCAFMAHVKQTKGNVSEPVWYYALGVLNCCTDRDTAIHTWSCGHPAYSREETEKKAAQWQSKNLGASTCKQLFSVAPDLCLGCPFRNAGASPLSVGITPDSVDKPRCKPSYGFVTTEHGIFYEKKPIYLQDIVPVSVGHDYTLGYEVAVFSVKDKFESWRQFRIRTALFNDTRACLMALADQGVTVQGGDAKKLMVQFLEGYINSLKQMEKRSKYCAQMGWQQDPNGDLIFVLGDTIYKKDGTENIGLAGAISEIAKQFRCEGSLEKWIELTKRFDTQGMEPLAFEFLTLAFGSPLMYFTGYAGAMVSAKGADSGVGKTVSAEWGLSAYGPPKKLELHQNDTQNALVSRLGVCNTLPIYIDEITEIKPEELSNLVYRITDGRDKLSLTSKREERAGQTWCTLALVTANNGVVDKLGGYKPDASAQINRVFEYDVRKNPKLTVDFWAQTVPIFMENYGHAGIEYVKYLAENQEDHKKQIQYYTELIQKKIGAYPEERFWVSILAATLYGASIAKTLGLIQFDISKVSNWAVNLIPKMRVHKQDSVTDAQTVLASYLGENIGSVLAVDTAGKIASILRDPNRGLIGRYEKNNHLLWISQSSLRECFAKYGYSRAKIELQEKGIIQETSARKILGAGTKYGLGMGQAMCWVVKVDDSWLKIEE